MISTVEEFYRVANRILHGMNPQIDDPEDIATVLRVLREMDIRKRSDGRYRDVIMKWFITHPFEKYFKTEEEERYIPIDKYVVDKKELFALESPYTYYEDRQPSTYKQMYNTRYLISNNGILYDMLYHHQEKMYVSKDETPIYYFIDNNNLKRTVSVKKLLESHFNLDELPLSVPGHKYDASNGYSTDDTRLADEVYDNVKRKRTSKKR